MWEPAKARAVAAKKRDEDMQEFAKNLKPRVFTRRVADTGAAERRIGGRARPTPKHKLTCYTKLRWTMRR